MALRGLFLINPDGVVVHNVTNFLPVGRSAKEALRTRTGVLFQDGALFSSLTVAENIQVPMRDEAGAIVGVCGIVRDITDRKHIERALVASEKHYRAM